MDRSIARFLCLPIFDDPFRGVLRDLKLDHVEFWLAMSDDASESADERLSAFLPALTDDQSVLDTILVRLEMVNILADMVTRSASRVQAENASDLGYGSAKPPRVGAKRAANQAILVAQPPGSFGMMPSGHGSTAQVSSIRTMRILKRRSGAGDCHRSVTAPAVPHRSMIRRSALGWRQQKPLGCACSPLKQVASERSGRMSETGKNSKNGLLAKASGSTRQRSWL